MRYYIDGSRALMEIWRLKWVPGEYPNTVYYARRHGGGEFDDLPGGPLWGPLLATPLEPRKLVIR